jgi:hypothetical protein
MAKPILYDTVNELYSAVMNHMPKSLQQRDVASAFVLGAAGSYGLTRALQGISKNIVDKIFPGFDQCLLPILERTCQLAMLGAPLLFAIIDPETAKAIVTQHPVYTSGMAGAATGGIIAAEQDLRKKPVRKKSLEREINKPVVYPPVEEKDL